MRSRLREADCPRPAFIEANGDLRAQRVFQRKSISRNPAKPVLLVALAAQRSQIRSSKQCLQPDHQSQEAIQSP
jgi:hypothetical protein